MSTIADDKTRIMSKDTKAKAVRRYTADLSAVGEPALWGFGGALALGIILICGFLLAIFWNGITTFWPKPIEVVTLKSGQMVAGEPSRRSRRRSRPMTATPSARCTGSATTICTTRIFAG